MEDTLGGTATMTSLLMANVLILVLMEDTLGDSERPHPRPRYGVLILVLMEDTLGEISVSRVGN